MGPPWDEPTLEDKIATLARELHAAEQLAAVLPPASRDRAMVDVKVDSIRRELRDLITEFMDKSL